jgi:uncharacterized protein (TIGR02996 family)
MLSDDDFARLRGLLSDPDARSTYADWLEHGGDGRAGLVRLAPDADDIRRIAWLERNGWIDAYVERFPEGRRVLAEWHASGAERAQRSPR